MRGNFLSYTFLNLFAQNVSSVAADLMRSGINPYSEVPVHVVTAPVAGIRFLSASGGEAERLNGWWERHVPADSLPVAVMLHEPGLERYLPGLDAEFVIGAANETDAARYAGLDNVRIAATDSALALTEYAMQSYAVAPARCFRMDFPYRAWRLEQPPPAPASPILPPPPASWTPAAAGLAGEPNGTPASRPVAGIREVAPGPRGDPPAEAGGGGARFSPREVSDLPRAGVPRAPRPLPPSGEAVVITEGLPDPFSELSKAQPVISAPGAAPTTGGVPLTRAQLLRKAGAEKAGGRRQRPGQNARSAGPAAAPRRGLAGLFGGGRRRSLDIPREIGDLVLGLRPAPVIAVVSRAGGVGKTAVAAALAQIVGYSIGETTGSAAIVDQNIGNPDQWGRLDIPLRSATVRSLMASLSSGADLPEAPAWANTPALAVYPEDRESAEPYSPGLVQRFVQYLRERHVFTVVDLPNRLPDASSAEGAICAFYLDVADLVIMPTTDDPNRLIGVLEYLDAPSLRGKPAIVSYIVSPDRRLRTHPRVVELLDRIRSRVTAVVAVPKSEKATFAIVEGVSILDVSPQLRGAYVQLALTTARALAG